MRTLITGNAGFVGGYLAAALLAEGHSVHGLDKRPMTSNQDGLTCQTGNILDREAATQAMAGCDVVFHLAAEHQDWGISREAYFETNQRGTRVLLDAATELGVTQFVLYSSVAIYGPSLVPATETSEPAPNNDYGASKLAAEQEVSAWAAQDPTRSALIVRPTVIFGPRMNDYSNIYRLVDQVARHRFFFVGKMANIKSLAYVENVVDATLFLSRQLKPGIDVYNITEQEHLTSHDITSYIAKTLGVYMPPFGLPYEPVLAAARVLDGVASRTGINLPITAARIARVNLPTHFRSDKLRLAGFQPKYSIRDGLDKACAWYTQGRS